LQPDVVSLDIDERRNRVAIGVDATAVTIESLALIDRLRASTSAPEVAVIVEPVGRFLPMQLTVQSRFRSIPYGVQIAYANQVCTLGFNAVHFGNVGLSPTLIVQQLQRFPGEVDAARSADLHAAASDRHQFNRTAVLRQLCQDIVSAGVQPGDSGAAVFLAGTSDADREAILIGLLWGGNAAGTQFIMSSWQNIMRTRTELGPISLF